MTQQAVNQGNNLTRAYIGLGSNLDDREGMLRSAMESLHQSEGIEVISYSSVYETDPVGYIEQPPFLNMVIEVGTVLSAKQLLSQCQTIEQSLGRTREIHWGPRTIDLDVLLYEGFESEHPELTIPHPRMHERLFVLIPLMEILPRTSRYFEICHQSLETLKEEAGVRLWKPSKSLSESVHFAN